VAVSARPRVSGIVAIIGAECSGKTTLAEALAERLPGVIVPEQLRRFVDQHGRAPTPAEQPRILQQQIAAEAAAATPGGWVVSDAGALMTAIYSALYYGDDGLVAPAVDHHRHACTATLWCDIDLPWIADGRHRDGPSCRLQAHRLIAEVLQSHPMPVVPISGSPAERLRTALAAVGAADR
jgi:nicotinamide riboside kinase